MKIHFTKKEYRLLLEMLHISGWVMTSYKIGEDPKAEPYKNLEQKLLSYAKDFGFGNLITYVKEIEEYCPTAEYEESGTDRIFIDEYDEEVFWEELCNRLAKRDFINEKGLENIKQMEPFARLTEEDKFVEKYNEEFEKNGLKNLIISKQ